MRMYLVTSSFLSIQSSSDLNGIFVSQSITANAKRYIGGKLKWLQMAGKFVIGDIFLFFVRGPLLRSIMDWRGRGIRQQSSSQLPSYKSSRPNNEVKCKTFLETRRSAKPLL